MGGSLESNAVWRIGTPDNFPKIKVPAWTYSKPQNAKNAASAISRGLQHKTQSAIKATRVIGKPRFVAHIATIALVAMVVLSSNFNSSRYAGTSLVAGNTGYGSVLDNAAAANVASSIAAKTALTVSADAAKVASNLNSQVALPTAGDNYLAKRQVVTTAGAAARGITNYTVKSGDTLGGVANYFNVTTSTLRWANNLDDDLLSPGQKLTILPISGLMYTVQPGDSAETIASKYEANAAQIISFNNAEVKGLVAGQKIVIPDGVKPEPVKPVVQPRQAQPYVPQLTNYAYGGGGYAYGYCTAYVASRRAIPGHWGDARNWYYNAQASGFSVGRAPVPGAIAWTPHGWYGHVAYVEQVSGSQVLVSEMNYGGNWNRVSSRWVSAWEFPGYIY